MATIDNNSGFSRKRKKKKNGFHFVLNAEGTDWIRFDPKQKPKPAKPQPKGKRKPWQGKTRVVGHTADSILTA
jgi:hypothetical protein